MDVRFGLLTDILLSGGVFAVAGQKSARRLAFIVASFLGYFEYDLSVYSAAAVGFLAFLIVMAITMFFDRKFMYRRLFSFCVYSGVYLVGTSPVEFQFDSEFGVALTTYQILTEKARVLQELQQYDLARVVYEQLLRTNPDDWSCWKGHLNCCVKETQNAQLTAKLVETTLEEDHPLIFRNDVVFSQMEGFPKGDRANTIAPDQ